MQSASFPVEVSDKLYTMGADKYFLYGTKEPKYIRIPEQHLHLCNAQYNNSRACDFTNTEMNKYEYSCETLLLENKTPSDTYNGIQTFRECPIHPTYPTNLIIGDNTKGIFDCIINTGTIVDIICPHSKPITIPLENSQVISMNKQCQIAPNNGTKHTNFFNATKPEFTSFEMIDTSLNLKKFTKIFMGIFPIIHFSGELAKGTIAMTEILLKKNSMTLTDLNDNPIPVLNTIVTTGAKAAYKYSTQILYDICISMAKGLAYIIGAFIIIIMTPIMIFKASQMIIKSIIHRKTPKEKYNSTKPNEYNLETVQNNDE